ncbi:uncharacterized protein LOC143559553 [Bidens hawaiensis]|uniref:uncharacterized protein LOC143559553 n=1 Tax=Bidens hawaiensis TaxID=980011 RepID=UPI00404AF979
MGSLEVVKEPPRGLIKSKQIMKAAQDRQKSYVDKQRRPIEFNVGDNVILKVSPWKPVEIIYRKDKQLRHKVILLVKVIWKHRKGSDATWETEEEMHKFYPQLVK